MMNIRERAAYAWGRIVELFSPKKPEIEVEVEELTDEFPCSEPDVEETETDYSPDDLDEDLAEETGEGVASPEAGETDFLQTEETSEIMAEIPNRMEEEPIPSRMTEEYKAWLAEQRETAGAETKEE